MAERVVVLGAGYAGATAIPALERELDDATITWVSENDYHLVLHEVHRVIRNPSVQDSITIPVEAIKSGSTEFVQARVSGINTDDRRVEFENADPIGYDYLLVALGSSTAFYGVPGLAEHAHTLKSLDDAIGIHEDIEAATHDASFADPACVVIGGAGLSGIQAAGEVAEYRDRHDAPIRITLVEALEEVLPGRDVGFQRAVRSILEERDIEILTGDPIIKADADTVHFDGRDPVAHDVLLWAGGITGREALEGADIDGNHNRLTTDGTFQTSDQRVFAVGDAAMIDLDGEDIPPTAEAAWSAAEVTAENIAREMDGDPLKTWTYTDKGTVMSIGEEAVAHDIVFLPIETFDSLPARLFKKAIAARWIASITSTRRALSSWSAL